MEHILPLAPSCSTFDQHFVFAILLLLPSPSPYLPPCLRWQKRHSCPVHWWGCGVGIQAAWAPPSLALEKYSKGHQLGQSGLLYSLPCSPEAQQVPSCQAHSQKPFSKHTSSPRPLSPRSSLCLAFYRTGSTLQGAPATAVLYDSLFSNDFIHDESYSSVKISWYWQEPSRFSSSTMVSAQQWARPI